MLEFDTLDELWLNALGQCQEGDKTGSRDGATTEVLGYAARLKNPYAHFVFNPVRRLSPAYAAAEFLWYLSGTDSIKMISAYAKQYPRFTEDGKHAWGAYGHRWAADDAMRTQLFMCQQAGHVSLPTNAFFHDNNKGRPEFVTPLTQLQLAAWLLKKNSETRQAVMTMWNAGDLPHAIAGDKNDLPCTLSLNFIQRDSKLNLVCTMRSNDVWLGLPYDVFCMTSILLLVAEAIGAKPGWYQHQATSMHLYDRNSVKAIQALDVQYSTDAMKYTSHHAPLRESIPYSVEAEKWIRGGKPVGQDMTTRLGHGSLLEQCLAMVATKWVSQDMAISDLTNKKMKQHMELLNADH